jgi:catechol 2,3-dioxygenase-like lactoylglutathione lyase family enzyme
VWQPRGSRLQEFPVIDPSIGRTAPPRGAITVPVTNLERSGHFYRDLLGLVETFEDERGLNLTLPLRASINLYLVPVAGPLSARRYQLELQDAGEVLDLYLLARMLDVDTAELRLVQGFPFLLLRDPDGHELECSPSASASDWAPGRWRSCAGSGAGRFAEAAARPRAWMHTPAELGYAR